MQRRMGCGPPGARGPTARENVTDGGSTTAGATALHRKASCACARESRLSMKCATITPTTARSLWMRLPLAFL